MVKWLQRTPKSLWLIEADPHRRRVHFITTRRSPIGRSSFACTSYPPIVAIISTLSKTFGA